MKVLMLSIDEEIMREGSDVQSRMKEYGALSDELHIIVYTRPGFQNMRLGENIFLYPTNTGFKPFYFFHGLSIAKKVVRAAGLGHDNTVISSQDAFTNLVALRIRRRFKIPFQVQVHTDFISREFIRESWKNYLRYLIYVYTVKKADCVRTVSVRIKQQLIARYRIPEARIFILPIFVDAEKIRAAPIAIDLHKKYFGYDIIILMASRITREKNIDMACEAVLEVARNFSRTLLLIAGDGPEKERLRKKYEQKSSGKDFEIDELNQRLFSSPPIKFEDTVPYDTLISYYKTCDIFLLTSNYEGYGRTLLEASVAGAPVFSTDVGIAREVIQNNETGRILQVGDVKSLREALMHVSLERSLLSMMKMKSRERTGGPVMPSKVEYLAAYKRSLEQCERT